MDLTDLLGPEGADNTPGIKQNIWIAPESWFDEIKGVKTTTLAGDAVTIDGPHVFKAGKGFIEAYSTQDTGSFKLEPTGERDGRGKKITGEFFHPGNKKAAAEFDRVIKNHSCIVLVEEMDGTITQYGSKGLGVEILGSYDTGKLSGGRRGYTYKVEGYANGMMFYESPVTLQRDVVVTP